METSRLVINLKVGDAIASQDNVYDKYYGNSRWEWVLYWITHISLSTKPGKLDVTMQVKSGDREIKRTFYTDDRVTIWNGDSPK
jgi:hypothetical protein